MTATLPPPAAPAARTWFLRDLDRPADAVSHLGPNWFASVMGTGVVGIAAAALPVPVPGLRAFGTVSWLMAATLLTVLVAAGAVHRARHPARAAGYDRDPVLAPFRGAVPMAVLTVGTGTVTFGGAVVGAGAAVTTGWALWVVGTLLGLVTAVRIPYLAIVHPDDRRDPGSATGLMPVVPPMVSAAGGALLVPHAPVAARPTMLVACYAMVGISLLATLVILPQIWNRLVVRGLGPAATVPTTWIVLGPLGQSVTALNLLGDRAGVLPEPYATGARVLGVLYGVPVWGFAMFWMALATALTVRTARRGLPFALTWWSFTFPVGTCVTATAALGAHLGLDALVAIAVLLFGVLLTAWAVVGARTVHGALVRGHLLVPVVP